MELALIGNCAYQALLDDAGRVVWLCWPRFDSSFVFGSLLDEDKGGGFSIEPADGRGETSQAYVPDTNILRTVVRGGGGELELIDFAPRFRREDRSYFKPTLLVRRVRRLSGTPRIRIRCEPVYDYGRLRLDRSTGSDHIEWRVPGARLRLTTNLPATCIAESRTFVLEDDAYLVLSWGEPPEAPLERTCASYYARTRQYWQRWVEHTTIPDCFQREVIRSALALKLHQYEDTGAITAATTTSIPEHRGSGRNWDYRYCWLRDAYFTLAALRRLGHREETESFASFLHGLVAASGDALQPVFGILGAPDLNETELGHLSGYRGDGPVRIGNEAFSQLQHDVYGEMIAALAPIYLDDAGACRQPDRPPSTALVHRLLGWIADTMEAPDAGLWEERRARRVHTFSLFMHWVGARVATRIGARCGDEALVASARALAQRAQRLIEDGCWREALGYYADSPDSNDADASLLLMVNLGYLDRDHPRAERHVRALVGALEVVPAGCEGMPAYLLRRYKHHDGIGDTRATFTVCGYWLAEALARLGFTPEGREVCSLLVSHANHVGLQSEDLDPGTGEQWGNFPQTYSHAGLIGAAFALD